MDVKRFSTLIESVYAAGAEERAWPDVAAQVVARFFDSDSAAIQMRGGHRG